MNKYLIIILIIFALIIITNNNNNKNKIKEKMSSNTCDYVNSLNVNRGHQDYISDSNMNVNEKCYFKGIDDSGLEINTLKPMVGNKLSRKQINIKTNDDTNKFFNYQNFQIVKPSYENENSDVITTPYFNEDATISRIPYLLHNDLFVRYYLSKINKNNFNSLNSRVDNFFNYILSSNVLKIDKILHDSDNDLKIIYSFDINTQDKKLELETEIVNKMSEIIIGYDKTKSVTEFIDTLETNKMKLIMMHQNNFLEQLLDNNNNFENMMDSVVFVISAEERMINYLAKCINRSEPSTIADGSPIILAKINSSDEDIRHCSILGINKERYTNDTRQILFDQMKSIYDNVYGLNEIPNLNISFNNDKGNTNYEKNMSGDLIRTSFDSLLNPPKHNIKTVQTATSYFGLCDSIEINNESRKNENIRINNLLKDMVTLPSEEESEFNNLSILKKSKILITSAEFKINELQASVDELTQTVETVLKDGFNKNTELSNLSLDDKLSNNQTRLNDINENLSKDDVSDEDKTNLNQEKTLRTQLELKINELKESPENISVEDEIIQLENDIYNEINLEQVRQNVKEIYENQNKQTTINELKNDLLNSDYRKYYVALAVSDKIKEFTSNGILNEISNRNASNFSTKPNYKTDFAEFDSSKTNRYTNLDYFPEADLINVDSNRTHPCLNKLNDDEKPILDSVFKCLIKKYTSIGISFDPYLAMDIAIDNCEPNAGILFLNKSRYFGTPKMNSNLNNVCNNYVSDQTFSNTCGQNNNCKIVKMVEINDNEKCNVHIGQGTSNDNENELINLEYDRCLKSAEKSNQNVTDKCNNNYPELFKVSVISNEKIRIKSQDINNYFKSIISNKINANDQTNSKNIEVTIGGLNATLKANTLEDELDDDDNIAANTILFESNENILLGDKDLRLKIPDDTRPSLINDCITKNKYYCKFHSLNDNSGNIPDIPLNDDSGNNIPKLVGEIRSNCDAKYQSKYSTYKCLTDCYQIGDNVYHNKMKATGLKVQKNNISFFEDDKFKTSTDRECSNISVNNHTWEEENDDFSKQSETIINQFAENGKANIIRKFKDKCNLDAKETAMKKCKNKLGDSSLCYSYKINGVLETSTNSEENSEENQNICQNTINNLNDICLRDENMNNPDMCNEAIVLGIKDNKCYAFQSSNQCYLDYLNGEQYDYFNINNIN